MLTPFGKEVRKLRMDHEPQLKLKDLAEKIEVSSAYLSAVETGSKAATPKLVDRIADCLGVTPLVRKELHRLASVSATTIQLSLDGHANRTREFATAFARKFPSLSADQVEELFAVIEVEEHDHRKAVKKNHRPGGKDE